MGVHTITGEFTSPVPAVKWFRAKAIDFDKLVPKSMPQVKSFEKLGGDGGPGTVFQAVINEDGANKLLKLRMDALNKEKMTYTYTVVDGLCVTDKIESICYDIKLEASPDGGCKGTYVTKYYPKPGCEIDQSEVTEGEAKAAGAYKAIEAYLLGNPDVCA